MLFYAFCRAYITIADNGLSNKISIPYDDHAQDVSASNESNNSTQPSSPANGVSDQENVDHDSGVTGASSPSLPPSLDEDYESGSGRIYYMSHEEERALNGANDDVSWELVVKSIEQGNENHTADLKEAHEAEIRSLQGELRRANTKIGICQKKLKQINEARSFDEDCRKENEKTMRHLITTSQNMQRQKDELQTQLDILSSDLENGHKSAVEADLQKEVRGLVDVINGMKQTNEEQQLSNSEWFKRNEKMLRDANKNSEAKEAELKRLRESYNAMSSDLVKAQETAQEYYGKMHNLGHEQERELNIDDLKKMVDRKDRAYHDLRSEAVVCFDRLTRLEKSSNKAQSHARQENCILRDELEELKFANRDLKEKKEQYQVTAENFLGFFYKKLTGSDVTDAMGDYFEIAINDNEKLSSNLETRNAKISDLRHKVKALEVGSQQNTELLESKERLVAELEQRIRDEEIKVHNAETDLGLTTNDHRATSDEKDRQIENLQNMIEDSRREATFYMNSKADECIQTYVLKKENEANFFRRECERLKDENSKLVWQQEMKHQHDSENQEHSYFNDCHNEQVGILLEKAYKEITFLREKIDQPIGFGPTFSHYAELEDHKAQIITSAEKIEVLTALGTKLF